MPRCAYIQCNPLAGPTDGCDREAIGEGCDGPACEEHKCREGCPAWKPYTAHTLEAACEEVVRQLAPKNLGPSFFAQAVEAEAKAITDAALPSIAETIASEPDLPGITEYLPCITCYGKVDAQGRCPRCARDLPSIAETIATEPDLAAVQRLTDEAKVARRKDALRAASVVTVADVDRARAEGVREGRDAERARVLALIDQQRAQQREGRQPDDHRLWSALRHLIASGDEPKGGDCG